MKYKVQVLIENVTPHWLNAAKLLKKEKAEERLKTGKVKR